VVPYHAMILLLWGAHIDLQLITYSYWSYYILKYVMKSKPNNPLNLNIKNAKRLGFEKLSVIQLQLILMMVLTKIVTSKKNNNHMFGIPVVQKSEVVVYIDLNPFEF
jgi:hypothetical protein